MHKQILKILTLVIPVLILTAMIAQHSYNKATGTLWRIPIEGFDPRDILRGHYMVYQYDWNLAQTDQKQSCKGTDCAICFENKSDDFYNPVARIETATNAKEQCSEFILGVSRHQNHFRIGKNRGNGLLRYYIPEADAPRLDRLLRNQSKEGLQFDIGLRLNGQGQAYIENMYINNIPLNDWLYHNPAQTDADI